MPFLSRPPDRFNRLLGLFARSIAATMVPMGAIGGAAQAAPAPLGAPDSSHAADPQAHTSDPAASDAALIQLVEDFAKAQQAFDPDALAALTAPGYLEVSPVGEVDERGRMLGFYTPTAAAPPAPALSIDEPRVRRFGETGIVVARLTYRRPGSEGPSAFAMRATFVARRDGDGEGDGQDHGSGWRLISAHYTPIRAPAL